MYLPLASWGGGKTRLGGVDPHLHGLLEDLPLQFHHGVPHRHLRAVDDVAVGGIVHRIGHLPQDSPHFRLHIRNELFLVQL